MLTAVINVMAHVSFLLCLAMIAVVARKCRKSHVRTAFLLVLSIMIVWCAGTLLELDFRTATGVTIMFFINICYIGICLIPVALLCLGKVILQPDWQPRRVHAAFLVIPVTSIVMVFTAPLHNLFFVNFSLHSSEAVYGAYYYFHSVYSYGCITAGVVLMLIAAVRYSGFFSMQSLLVISGVIIPAVPNMLYSFGVADLPFSISAAAFTASILCFAVAFLKYHFITTLPITLRHVVDLISDGYLVIDRQLCILAYNKALLHMFLKPVSIIIGENLRTTLERNLPDASYDRILELHGRSVAQMETVSVEWHLFENTYVSVEITPVIQHNTHIGSIMLLKDITKSKLLIETTKAESRYKSEFLSNMSHEIRTPMNAIIGMINIGKSADTIERKDYCLTRIEDASKHLLGIINDVLDISKIEAGKFELSPEEFVFEKMIQRIVNVIKYQSDEKKQTLTTHIDRAIPEILVGDDQRLAQVITNLIGNAVKFTPENGSIKLNTKLLGEENGLYTIQFEVTDTGIGISPEQQARLFQSFTQAEASTSRKFGGTGLGLTISKSIIEKMNGRIWIESEPGQGATFIFTVQLAEGTMKKQDRIVQKAESSDEDNTGIFKGAHIMLVEDVEINREIVLTLLEPTLMGTDCAENGLQAVRMFSEAPDKYDIILMDVQMPEMDGYEATRRIRAFEAERVNKNRVIEHSQQTNNGTSFTKGETRSYNGDLRKQIPIIAMTANVFREDIERCLEAGMNDHIGKPIDHNELIQKLRMYTGVIAAM